MLFLFLEICGFSLHRTQVSNIINVIRHRSSRRLNKIDNAIVVVYEVQNRLKTGLNPTKAIKQTVNYLFIPLLASTLTTVCAFLPIASLTGPTGEFVGTIGINVIIALIFSLLISLCIIPAIAAHFSPKNFNSSSFLPLRWLNQGFSWGWLTRKYRWS